ncbi:MAG: hypothetical protein MUP70_00770, partial [Candidatus Aminicenantes bacterium]|nr:hypothetical protein [Candidatus Aminicenantes bacterium]
EHYFNCPACFEELKHRSEILAVIKEQGPTLFQNLKEPVSARRPSFFPGLRSFFTPKQWIVTGISAVLIAVLAVGIAPSLKKPSSKFFVNDDIVRGESIKLISPVIDINIVPTQFTWEKSGKEVEYKIYLYAAQLLWSATTKDATISVPAEVQAQMKPGQKYSWQVKAFSPEGVLISMSSQVQFRIIN